MSYIELGDGEQALSRHGVTSFNDMCVPNNYKKHLKHIFGALNIKECRILIS